jgi:hypothetical protein
MKFASKAVLLLLASSTEAAHLEQRNHAHAHSHSRSHQKSSHKARQMAREIAAIKSKIAKDIDT